MKSQQLLSFLYRVFILSAKFQYLFCFFVNPNCNNPSFPAMLSLLSSDALTYYFLKFVSSNVTLTDNSVKIVNFDPKKKINNCCLEFSQLQNMTLLLTLILTGRTQRRNLFNAHTFSQAE